MTSVGGLYHNAHTDGFIEKLKAEDISISGYEEF
jgi:hypothetical protein